MRNQFLTPRRPPGAEGDAPGLLDTIVPAVVLRFNRLRLSGDLDELTETDVALAAGALAPAAAGLIRRLYTGRMA